MGISDLKDVKLDHLAIIFLIRIFELAFAALGLNKIFLLIIYFFVCLCEFFVISHLYFDEGGVLTLKFAEMILLDNERIKRRFEKYRISTEIEYLKEYYREISDFRWEYVTKQLLFSLYLLKFFLYSSLIFGFDLSILQLLFMSLLFVLIEIFRGLFQVHEVKEKKEKEVEEINIIEHDTRRMKNDFLMILLEVMVNLVTISVVYLPQIWFKEVEEVDQVLPLKENPMWNFEKGIKFRGQDWTKNSLNIFTWIILKNVFSKSNRKYYQKTQYLVNTVILALTSFLYIRSKPEVFTSDYLKIILIQVVHFLHDFDKTKTEFIKDYFLLASHFFVTVFFNQEFSLYDHIYTMAILFIVSILKYKKFAIKLAEIFNFMHKQLFYLTILYIIFKFENMNFSGTEDIWNKLPENLHGMLGKFLIYILIIILVLLCVYYNKYVTDVPMDIDSNEYHFFMLALYTIRNIFGGKPADELTKKKIREVNKVNIYVFFVLGNLFFYQNHFYCFTFNCLMIAVSAYFFEIQGLDTLQLCFFFFKLLIRLSKPILVYILTHLVFFIEKFGFEERGLKLAVFHLSDVDHFQSCSYYLPRLNIDREVFEYDCGFKRDNLNIIFFSFFMLHLIIFIIADYFKKHREHPVLYVDYLLLIEEILSAAIFVGGVFYGFYIDFTFISASIYVYLYKKRIWFDWD